MPPVEPPRIVRMTYHKVQPSTHCNTCSEPLDEVYAQGWYRVYLSRPSVQRVLIICYECEPRYRAELAQWADDNHVLVHWFKRDLSTKTEYLPPRRCAYRGS